VLQPRVPESHATAPAGANGVPVPAETSLGIATAAPAMADVPEPSQTAEPVREEVGPPAPSSHPARSGVKPVGQEPQRTRRTRRTRATRKADEEQVELWSQAPASLDSGAPAAAVHDVPPNQAAPAVENCEILADTPLPAIAPESPREIEPVSAPEPPPMLDAAAEDASAPAWPERDESAWAELSARIERLGQKQSVEFMGKTLTGASSGIPASTPQLHEGGRSVEGAGSEEAEKFLHMATRALDGKGRLSEANNAASEVAAAKKRLSDLNDAEELVKTTRSKFKAQLDEILRDPNAASSRPRWRLAPRRRPSRRIYWARSKRKQQSSSRAATQRNASSRSGWVTGHSVWLLSMASGTWTRNAAARELSERPARPSGYRKPQRGRKYGRRPAITWTLRSSDRRRRSPD